MRSLTIKLFLSVFPPISGYCKQERCEHAWPVAHCGRTFSLSSTSGLRLDTRSADARSPPFFLFFLSAGCAAVLCVFTQGFSCGVFWSLGLPLVHTPQKKTLKFPHLLRAWIPTRKKRCWLCSVLWDFPKTTVVQTFKEGMFQLRDSTLVTWICSKGHNQAPPSLWEADVWL